jgi:hypothetical protein
MYSDFERDWEYLLRQPHKSQEFNVLLTVLSPAIRDHLITGPVHDGREYIAMGHGRMPFAKDDGLPDRMPAVSRIRQMLAQTFTEGEVDVVCIHLMTTTRITTRNIDLSEGRISVYIHEPSDSTIIFRLFEGSRNVDKQIG